MVSGSSTRPRPCASKCVSGETAGEDEEARVRDHPVRRSNAPVADVPEADERLEGLDAAESAVCAEAVDELLHLEHGRQEAGQDGTGTEGGRGDREKAPRFGEIDHQTVDVALEEPLEGVRRAERPVGGLAVVP